jgi:hypothetical protein
LAVQWMKTMPRRFTTLQNPHRRFTDARTFILFFVPPLASCLGAFSSSFRPIRLAATRTLRLRVWWWNAWARLPGSEEARPIKDWAPINDSKVHHGYVAYSKTSKAQ